MSRTLTDDDLARAAKESTSRSPRSAPSPRRGGAPGSARRQTDRLIRGAVFHQHTKGAHRRQRPIAGASPVVAELEPLALWRDRREPAQPDRGRRQAGLGRGAQGGPLGDVPDPGREPQGRRPETIKGFVDAMHSGAGAHLDAFVAFMKVNKLDGALRAQELGGVRARLQRPGLRAERLRQENGRRLCAMESERLITEAERPRHPPAHARSCSDYPASVGLRSISFS